ncbi:MAG: EAL domain-containing protein [Proteobacteria bacterium]|nr:EAL domain-containing protein [Pseudomonadota bacterium]
MQEVLFSEPPRGQPGTRFDPYVRLIRSLFPRAASVSMFGPDGNVLWSTDTMTGPDLVNAVEDALLRAAAEPSTPGQLRLLEGGQAVYLFVLWDRPGALRGIVVVPCRAAEGMERRPPDFAFAQSLLAPVLECLRRDLTSGAAIDELKESLRGMDRDLSLLLTQGDSAQGAGGADGAQDLQVLLQQTLEHLRSGSAALLVPEKNLTLLRSAGANRGADTQFLMRSHRQLAALAQQQREPLIRNQIQSASAPEAFPYRVLCCPLRSRTDRSVGVLILLRDAGTDSYTSRDAHIAQIMARKSMAVIESSYDSLSGLYSRAAFERRVRSVVTAPAASGPWSGLYIDVDQLHAINEKCGMHVGDAALAQLGELLRRRLPPGAFGARISGDRFVLMLPAQVCDAEAFAESVRQGAEQLAFQPDNPRLRFSVSIGVALVDVAADELAHALAAAETACRAAKDRGRNRVETYQQSDVSIVRRFADIGIADRLRAAIDGGRLHLDAQLILPFAGVHGGRPHYELLLRMTDEQGHTVGPDSFLSAATRYQLMPAIDRWVVNHAIEVLKPHAAVLQGQALGFAINFSGQSLLDDAFSGMLLERVAGSGLDPRLFCFELTENATVTSLARAESLMTSLRRLGCGVALDDFGVGLSSLSCLRQLPVTMLKIDGSFVRDVLKDPRAESMVHAIAQLARSMSIVTVAEYIETEAISTRVAELGVDYGQGFAIGRPMPLVDLLSELTVRDTSGPFPAPPVAAASH